MQVGMHDGDDEITHVKFTENSDSELRKRKPGKRKPRVIVLFDHGSDQDQQIT